MKNGHTLYKLTDENCRTYGDMLWEVGKTNYARGKGKELCTSDVLHAYTDPLLAVLLNPIHANFKNPRIFRITGNIVADDGLKIGSKWQRVECETDLPRPSKTVMVTFAILCGLAVCHEPSWRMWAWNWLDGTDRSSYTANMAAYAVNATSEAYAAYAAARAASAAYAAAYVAAYVADAAARAASEAYAAYAAARADDVNLIAIADMAFRLAADGI